MKKKTKIIIIIIAALALLIAGVIIIKVFSDKSRLNIIERNWINDNVSTIQNVNVLNDNGVFGMVGKGVFFDFIEDFSKEYNIDINAVAMKTGDNPSGLTLGYSNIYEEKDVIFYTDHYVVLSKNYELISDYRYLENKTIGILNNNLAHVTSYINDSKINYIQYEKREDLEKSLLEDTVSYIIVPRVEYLDFLLENNLYVIEHLSDVPTYYLIKNTDNTLGSIFKKFYINWQDQFDDYFNKSEFALFTSKLNISETEVDALRGMDFNYGFVNTSPYEVITGGSYGGIVAIYLKEFSSFADLDINFTKYKNLKKFYKAIEKKEIDFYFNYYNLTNNYQTVKAGMAVEYAIITQSSNSEVINSLKALKGKEVYVLEDSLIKNTLESIQDIKLKTYKNTDSLLKLAKKDVIIVLDKNIFEYYRANELKSFVSKHSDFINSEYSFKINNTNAFYKLFERFINTIDYNEAINRGIYNHFETVKSGTLLGQLAKYFLYILFLTAVIVYLLYRRTKKVTIIKKIKREDKMKYIDQLTSLKNRNYLNENLDNWNNNKIYPQTMIVIDLNNIQYINDTLGYEEGDKQIKAVANILIKTQLDYSDIMRTDGNEFTIYLIGYTQKQITSYIHKLNKEFKKLPYEYGAEFGYSMIIDDIKTIEDAINEAVEQMKVQKKEANKDEKSEKKN